MPDASDEEVVGIISRVRKRERIAEYAKRLNLTNEQVLDEPNEDFEYALLIWQMDDLRAKLQSKERKTE